MFDMKRLTDYPLGVACQLILSSVDKKDVTSQLLRRNRYEVSWLFAGAFWGKSGYGLRYEMTSPNLKVSRSLFRLVKSVYPFHKLNICRPFYLYNIDDTEFLKKLNVRLNFA